jgi:hypothetical protein
MRRHDVAAATQSGIAGTISQEGAIVAAGGGVFFANRTIWRLLLSCNKATDLFALGGVYRVIDDLKTDNLAKPASNGAGVFPTLCEPTLRTGS